jgi:hypothetical protein
MDGAMKSGKTKGPARAPRHDRFVRGFQHDADSVREKLPQPAACKVCGAVFHKGRWQWSERPAGAHETTCPACLRIQDKRPAGYLTLSGPFFVQHQDEILHLARHTEAHEKAEHPLHRIMAIEDRGDDVVVTTTAMEMARAIGTAINNAYQGTLSYHYTDQTDLLRVDWRR